MDSTTYLTYLPSRFHVLGNLFGQLIVGAKILFLLFVNHCMQGTRLAITYQIVNVTKSLVSTKEVLVGFKHWWSYMQKLKNDSGPT